MFQKLVYYILEWYFKRINLVYMINVLYIGRWVNQLVELDDLKSWNSLRFMIQIITNKKLT